MEIMDLYTFPLKLHEYTGDVGYISVCKADSADQIALFFLQNGLGEKGGHWREVLRQGGRGKQGQSRQ